MSTMETPKSTAIERLRDVFADMGTRLDKIVGPWKARAGDLRVAVRCPWHTEQTPSFVLDFGMANDPKKPKDGEFSCYCFGCRIKGNILFSADDGEGTDAYAIVRRFAKSDDEIHEITTLGV